jgi:hypothetical protein
VTEGKRKPGRPPGSGKNSRNRVYTRERVTSGEVVQVVLLLERPVFEELQAAAKQQERSPSAHVRWLVREWLRDHATAK